MKLYSDGEGSLRSTATSYGLPPPMHVPLSEYINRSPLVV